MQIDKSKVYRPAEVADHLGVSARTVQREIEAGALPAYKFGSHYRVHGSDLAAYIDAARTVAVTR